MPRVSSPDSNLLCLSPDPEAATFVQIAQFCNSMNEDHWSESMNENLGPGNGLSAVTLLTGDRLVDKKPTNLSFGGILNALSVTFEQIGNFYDKYRKK